MFFSHLSVLNRTQTTEDGDDGRVDLGHVRLPAAEGATRFFIPLDALDARAEGRHA